MSKFIKQKGQSSPLKKKNNGVPPGAEKHLIKVTIPRIIVDNPMACFASKDGTFVEELPVTSALLKLMMGHNEGYFELIKDRMKIISMTPISQARYEGNEHSLLRLVPSEK